MKTQILNAQGLKKPTYCYNAAEITIQTQITSVVPARTAGRCLLFRTGSTSAAQLNKAQVLSTYSVSTLHYPLDNNSNTTWQ